MSSKKKKPNPQAPKRVEPATPAPPKPQERPRHKVARQRGFWVTLKRLELLPLLALCVITFFAWGHTYDRLHYANWAVPISYDGDSQQILGWIKASAEGDYAPFCNEIIHRLGAPYQANWNDYPMYEKTVSLVLGLLARVIGLCQASNAGILLGHLTSVVSFYLCCRFLRYRRVWSFVGALLFAFTYYNVFRGLGHLLLAYSYTLPWAILSTWLVLTSRHMRLGDRSSWVCLVTSLVMGLSNPYNLNMYMQLLCFSLFVNFIARRRKQNLQVGFLSLGLGALGFLAINANTFIYQWRHGKNSGAIVRLYLESELSALKPMELFIPPPVHSVPFMAHIGDLYRSVAYVRGEIFSPYLGILCIAGLIWMGVEALVLLQRPGRRKFPPHLPQIAWVLIYSTLGGLNCLVALAGLQLFRSTNRYSIFISVVILLYLVSKFSRFSRRWPRWLDYGLAGVILLVGLYDQLPRPITHDVTLATAKLVQSDQKFARTMEEKLPPGAMVYQLPVMVFPDAIKDRNVDGYEHMRPFYFTRTLRFSFGSNRGRPREDWQSEVERMDLQNMLKTLENYGFSALYMNRKAFTNQYDDLVKEFASLGKTQVMQDDMQQEICVFLNPSPHPELPHTDDRPQVNFVKGWTGEEHVGAQDRLWTGGDAKLTFFNPERHPVDYSIKGFIGTVDARHVSIVINGKALWNANVAFRDSSAVDLLVTAKPGNNTVWFRTKEQPSHLPAQPGVPISIAVINFHIEKAAPGQASSPAPAPKSP